MGRGVRRNAVTFLIAIAAILVAGLLQVQESNALYPGGPLHAMESAAQDAVLRARDPERYGTSVGRDPRELMTIVAIDEQSLAELGIFRAWPRSYYAQVIDNLMASPPRAVVLDIGFFESSPDDAQLAGAIDRARSARPATAVVLAAAGTGDASVAADGAVAFTGALEPVAALRDATPDIGITNVLVDDRGAVRSMPLLADVDDVQQPTLGLLGAARYLRRPTYVDGRPDPETFVLAGRQIPVDATSALRINYFGRPSDPGSPNDTFPIVSFVDVLRGRTDPAIWRDGIVYIGLLGTTGSADDYWTPVSDQGHKMSGVEIHANVTATLLSTQFLRQAPLAADLGLIAAMALLVGALAANFGVTLACAASLVVLGACVIADLAVLNLTGLQLAIATPVLGGVLTFVGATAYRVAVEQRQARALQSALASVIPADVAREIGRNPERVRLGGERRLVTVLFTDLKDFTGFAESVDPEVLTRIITEYLDAMTQVVFELGGTLDKFIGDSVMAFWNAPLDDPRHAWNACQAAIRMQQALSRLSDRWQAAGLARHGMRIGINTGYASVGNMGSTRRFAYTAVGDAVNLASRLEPLNNEYGTSICISQSTLDAANASRDFLVRFLDLVVVKGKRHPVAVYELICQSDDQVVAGRYAQTLELYHRAVVLYQAQQFAAAAELFAEASRAGGDGLDAPSDVYVERCRILELAPPGDAWNQVYVMKHK